MSEQQQLSDVVKSEQLSGGESHFKVHTGILLVTKLSFNNNCIHRSLVSLCFQCWNFFLLTKILAAC